MLRTDSGTEDTIDEFEELFCNHGIHKHETITCSAYQNGVAERRNLVLLIMLEACEVSLIYRRSFRPRLLTQLAT